MSVAESRAVLLPLLCREGRGEVEHSTPPHLPLQRGGNCVVVAPLTTGRKLVFGYSQYKRDETEWRLHKSLKSQYFQSLRAIRL